MGGLLYHSLSNRCCKSWIYFLAIPWVVGLLLGSILFLSVDGVPASLMHSVLFSELSISGLLTVVLLPLLFAAFAVYISQPIVLYLVVFFKAFTFAFILTGYLVTFVPSGWLICGMLMFSDIVVVPFFWYFLLQIDRCDYCSLRRNSAGYLICAAVIVLFDYCFIMPFWAELISFQKG